MKIISTSIIVLSIIFLIWRWHFFHVLYMRSVNVTGYIHSADAFRTGGSRVEYKYEYKGEKYWRGNALTHSVFFNCNFHDGDEVVLQIDPENPKWAVIKDIYF
ncbi:hypothetical protein [Methanolobus sp. ZRKC5]|uniref:hypothetical protein n=1 Tax=Methanolobus sp. ZRKC5 TaxID=3136295 RepID=UPI00313B6115